MRFLFALIIFVTALAIIVFAINNVGTTVPVTLISTHPDLQLIVVVFSAIAFGSIFVGVVAIMEGAKTRLENRRLRREVHKLETELNFLRTEPRIEREPSLPPALPAGAPASAPPAAPPSAPVYEARGEDDDPDGTDDEDDDEMYAGGRAV